MKTERTPGQQKLLDRIENDFTYHRPPIDRQPQFHELRAVARTLAKIMVDYVPEGRELSTALTRLEEAVMHANAGIARQFPAETNTST